MGIGFTAQFGGPGLPFTFGDFIRTFYVHTQDTSTTTGNNPAKRATSADFSYRVPGIRDWLTVYGDALTVDEISPIGSTRATVNPGITVADGVVHYQLLPHNHVKIESGEWPFMGGRLILHETVLDFSQHSAKHLTFELQGFNAKMFVDSLGFNGFELTGIFDGEHILHIVRSSQFHFVARHQNFFSFIRARNQIATAQT